MFRVWQGSFEHCGSRWVDKEWCASTTSTGYRAWRRDGDEIPSRISRSRCPRHRHGAHRRPLLLRARRSVTEAGVQPVYSLRVDTADHAFITNGFVSHNTEARLTPLAMEMLREIDEETVDFIPNYDGRVQEPTVLPSRFPNLLANGSGGIAVGMATNIPPHNLRELAEAVFWCLENHEADEEATLAAVHGAGQGSRLPHPRPDRRLARHPRRLHHRPRLDPDARRGGDRRGLQGPHLARHHRAALPGQPRQLHHLDRRAGPRRQAGRHLQHRGPGQRPRRHAHRRRDQARRGGQGGAEQPLQAHPAADQLRRQHAVDRRRGTAHAAAGPADPATTSTTSSTSSSGAPPTGCARPTSGPTSCAVWSRRSTRSTKSSR